VNNYALGVERRTLGVQTNRQTYNQTYKLTYIQTDKQILRDAAEISSRTHTGQYRVGHNMAALVFVIHEANKTVAW
jgi:hypothetical protein